MSSAVAKLRPNLDEESGLERNFQEEEKRYVKRWRGGQVFLLLRFRHTKTIVHSRPGTGMQQRNQTPEPQGDSDPTIGNSTETSNYDTMLACGVMPPNPSDGPNRS